MGRRSGCRLVDTRSFQRCPPALPDCQIGGFRPGFLVALYCWRKSIIPQRPAKKSEMFSRRQREKVKDFFFFYRRGGEPAGVRAIPGESEP